MKLKKALLSPDRKRPEIQSNEELNFRCEVCSTIVVVEWKAVTKGAWTREYPLESVKYIAEFFNFTQDQNIARLNPRLNEGRPSITKQMCSGCNSEYVYVVDHNEFANSAHAGILQGIARVDT